jgi:hypothetical protein
MESYYESVEKEISALKEIVNNVFGVDLSKSTRERQLVDARRVYSKVLRDRNYTFELIGKSLGKDHATILHYTKSIDSILLYDKDLRDKYLTCKSLFLEGREQVLIKRVNKDVDLFMTVIKLNAELQESIKEKKEMLSKFEDYIKQYERRTGTKLPNFNI